MQLVTVLSPEEGMQDIVRGDADAAFIWGPSAGWINKTNLHDAYKVVPVAGPHMQWPMAIGFPREQTALRDEVDRALENLGDRIVALTTRYGFPEAKPIQLTAGGTSTPASNELPASSTPTGAAHDAAQHMDGAARDGAQTPGPDGDQIAAGHKLFNDNCAHCHGPDAIQGERRRNLRQLVRRYGDDVDQIFIATVTHGRVTKGMPNWSDILTGEQFHAILAFLHSVQEP
jgi:polar amino acid transport system substrate-binding protein